MTLPVNSWLRFLYQRNLISRDAESSLWFLSYSLNDSMLIWRNIRDKWHFRPVNSWLRFLYQRDLISKGAELALIFIVFVERVRVDLTKYSGLMTLPPCQFVAKIPKESYIESRRELVLIFIIFVDLMKREKYSGLMTLPVNSWLRFLYQRNLISRSVALIFIVFVERVFFFLSSVLI